MFTLGHRVTGRVAVVQYSVVKLHEATQIFMMVVSVREVTVKKSSNYGEYGSFQHLLFLFTKFYGCDSYASMLYSPEFTICVAEMAKHGTASYIMLWCWCDNANNQWLNFLVCVYFSDIVRETAMCEGLEIKDSVRIQVWFCAR